jgi:hypothetical protein
MAGVDGAVRIIDGVTVAREEPRRRFEQLEEEQAPAALAEVQRLPSAADAPAWPCRGSVR